MKICPATIPSILHHAGRMDKSSCKVSKKYYVSQGHTAAVTHPNSPHSEWPLLLTDQETLLSKIRLSENFAVRNHIRKNETSNSCLEPRSLWQSCCSVTQSVMPDSLWPHARLPCPSLSPRVCSDSCLLSWWCHPTTEKQPQCPTLVQRFRERSLDTTFHIIVVSKETEPWSPSQAHISWRPFPTDLCFSCLAELFFDLNFIQTPPSPSNCCLYFSWWDCHGSSTVWSPVLQWIDKSDCARLLDSPSCSQDSIKSQMRSYCTVPVFLSQPLGKQEHKPWTCLVV